MLISLTCNIIIDYNINLIIYSCHFAIFSMSCIFSLCFSFTAFFSLNRYFSVCHFSFHCLLFLLNYFLVVALGFSYGSAGKESACNVGDLSPIPGLRRSPGEGKGYPLQYSGLENSMDFIVYGVSKSWTQLRIGFL